MYAVIRKGRMLATSFHVLSLASVVGEGKGGVAAVRFGRTHGPPLHAGREPAAGRLTRRPYEGDAVGQGTSSIPLLATGVIPADAFQQLLAEGAAVFEDVQVADGFAHGGEEGGGA